MLGKKPYTIEFARIEYERIVQAWKGKSMGFILELSTELALMLLLNNLMQLKQEIHEKFIGNFNESLRANIKRQLEH